MENSKETCKKCQGKGMVKEADGTVHICYDCLMSGRLDQHNPSIKDAKDLGIQL
jgi:DnaJ-class molecular chaperone